MPSLTINSRISDVKLLSFNITEYGNSLDNSPSASDYNFDLETAYFVNKEKSEISMIFNGGIVQISTQQLLASFSVSVHFHIDEFDSITKEKDGELAAASGFLRVAANEAIATARGLIHSQISQTKFYNAFLPMNIGDLFYPENNNKRK